MRAPVARPGTECEHDPEAEARAVYDARRSELERLALGQYVAVCGRQLVGPMKSMNALVAAADGCFGAATAYYILQIGARAPDVESAEHFVDPD